ncbi:MAG: hypothetical protein WBM14_14970 [Terracidiphilus sp.]
MLVIVGVLVGFAPTYFKLVAAHHEIDSLSQQLSVTKRAEAMDSFRNRAALIYTESSQNNFTVALEMASKYFTDLQAFADQAADSTLNQELGNVLMSRDAIISGLAKADPATSGQIQELFLKLQKIN